jgi:hypothetical protein
MRPEEAQTWLRFGHLDSRQIGLFPAMSVERGSVVQTEGTIA